MTGKLIFLIAEDDKDTSELYSATIESIYPDSEIHTVITGEAAISRIKKLPYVTFGLFDFKLASDMTGLEALANIHLYQSSNGIPKSPIVLITGSGAEGPDTRRKMEKMAMASGAAGCYFKPLYDLDEVVLKNVPRAMQLAEK